MWAGFEREGVGRLGGIQAGLYGGGREGGEGRAGKGMVCEGIGGKGG